MATVISVSQWRPRDGKIHASWEDFGKFGQKMNDDSEWQQFWANALLNPTADMLDNSVMQQMPGID
jgi:hypothetical protein